MAFVLYSHFNKALRIIHTAHSALWSHFVCFEVSCRKLLAHNKLITESIAQMSLNAVFFFIKFLFLVGSVVVEVFFFVFLLIFLFGALPIPVIESNSDSNIS